jgi:hypothetical protein
MASFEEQRLLNYVAELRDTDVLRQISELRAAFEQALQRIAELDQRRGPGRPRKAA